MPDHRATTVVSCAEMKRIEAAAFHDGVTADALMDEAGAQIASEVRRFFPNPGVCVVYYAKGHNGGDALVAARHLAESGWTIFRRDAIPKDRLNALTAKKLEAVREKSRAIAGPEEIARARPLVVLDGLLGIGASGELREPIRSLAAEINELRHAMKAWVFAIDLPSGLDSGTGEPQPDCVVADFTLAIGFAKTPLLADAATGHVGRLAILPLRELTARAPQTFGSCVAMPEDFSGLLPRRRFDSHKTEFGRVAIVAGSMGLAGAAVMTATGALRAGAGLVTLYVTRDIHGMVAPGAPPEVMVQPVEFLTDVLDGGADVIAIGPGLGNARRLEILRLMRNCEQPMVVDADALNALAGDAGLLRRCAGPRLLTPHPGEMNRLFQTENLSRAETARAFTERYPVTLLLKGARTVVAEKGRALSFNTTGNPGMATGGVGDVLTGICAALIGQGLEPYDAARLGAWLSGRATELAIFEGVQCSESFAATDGLAYLGRAFRELG